MGGVLSFPDHESMDRWLIDTLGMSLREINASRLPPDKDVTNHGQVEALLARCRDRVTWRGVVIPEAESCEPVQLCETDRRALGEREMY